ncbi:MFS transporter [Pantoea agglomerans]|nr:MFS transporter [Pantoea agglomerans]WRO92309.1 MFS transporter [Pantoea agglomerans]
MLRNKMAFFGLCLGFFIIMMDTTTVPLIYTSIINDYQVTPAMAAWVNNSYLITYAGFLLFGGRLGDAINRKTVLYYALIILAIGALLSGSGQTLIQVILGRALMGVGAGLLTPQSMAFISIIFTQGGRGTALGIWGAVAGIATATGPVVTQIFLQTIGWRWIMWINIPVALIALIFAVICLPGTPGNGAKSKELLSNAIAGIALAAIILGLELLNGGMQGMTTGLLLLLPGILLFAFMLHGELKNHKQYLLPSSLWKDRAFLRTCLISGLLGFGLTAFYLPLAYLIELRMGFGPVAISVIMVTIALANALVGPFAGHFSDKAAPETLIRWGMCCFAAATMIIGITGLMTYGGSVAFIIIITAMALAGIGTGLAFAPLANQAFSRATFNNFGRAAAFFNVVRQMMSALGSVAIAIFFDYLLHNSEKRSFTNENSLFSSGSPSVAFASFGCFLIITGLLGLGAWLSRTYPVVQSVIKETK